jgi:hypothetical protein
MLPPIKVGLTQNADAPEKTGTHHAIKKHRRSPTTPDQGRYYDENLCDFTYGLPKIG